MNNSERSLDQSAGAENLAGAQGHVLKSTRSRQTAFHCTSLSKERDLLFFSATGFQILPIRGAGR